MRDFYSFYDLPYFVSVVTWERKVIKAAEIFHFVRYFALFIRVSLKISLDKNMKDLKNEPLIILHVVPQDLSVKKSELDT